MTRNSSKQSLRAATAAFAIGFIACALSGCAPHAAPPPVAAAPPPASDQQALAALLNGSADLACGQDCAAAWNTARPELARRLAGHDWRGLATLALQTRYRQDLGYYYLGRAAEELGAPKAALHYYQAALALTVGTAPELRCGARPGGCDGASLPTDEALHIEIARSTLTQRLAANRAAAAPHPANGDTAPAGGNWVDPPPAGE